MSLKESPALTADMRILYYKEQGHLGGCLEGVEGPEERGGI